MINVWDRYGEAYKRACALEEGVKLGEYDIPDLSNLSDIPEIEGGVDDRTIMWAHHVMNYIVEVGDIRVLMQSLPSQSMRETIRRKVEIIEEVYRNRRGFLNAA